MSGLYLYLSENREFSDSVMWQNFILNCYPFPNPTAISSSSHFPIINS